MIRHTATITNIKPLSVDVKHFTVKPKENIDFKAGQFIKTILNDGKEFARSYSIASAPNEKGTFDLCVKILPDGLGSHVFDNFTVGDSIEFEGPMGRFVIEDLQRDYVFIAAGVGIAPIRGHVQHLLNNNYQKKAIVYFGFRSDYYYQEELEELKKKDNFSLLLTASRPPNNWNADTGRVHSIVKKHLEKSENAIAYVCGPPQMIRDIVPLLRDKGFERKDIKLDIWEA